MLFAGDMGALLFPEPPDEPEADFTTSPSEFMGPEASDSDDDLTPVVYNGLEFPPPSGWSTSSDEESSDSELGWEAAADEDSPVIENGQNQSSLWAGPASDIDLGEEKEAQVKAAMAGFSLPPSALPPWAAFVPEEQWQQEIRDRIAKMKDDVK